MRSVLLLPVAFSIGGILFAQPKVAKELGRVHPDASVNVLVRYRRAIDDAQIDKVKRRGGTELGRFVHAGYAVASVPAGKLLDLSTEPDIDYIAPDRPVKANLDVSRAATMAEYAIATGLTGQGIGVAVIDSGIGEHPDLTKSRVVYSEGFGFKDGNDQYGHGTPVAGIIGGSGAASGGRYRGIASGVRLINLRVLGAEGEGTDSAVIAAIDRAIELRARYNIRIINLSLGRPPVESYKQDPLCQSVEAAWRAGIVVVVAAGNEGRNDATGNKGYGTILAPANHPLVITVGALKTMNTPFRDDDVITSYSSKGPTAIDHILKPDIIAPGNLIVSTQGKGAQTLEVNYPANVVPGGYFRISGTSVAAPMVSGAVALLLQRSPRLSPDQVKAILMRSAWKSFPPEVTAVDPATNVEYSSRHDAFTVGAGSLDINAALNTTAVPVGTAASPTVYYDTVQDLVKLRFTSNPLWGTTVVWSSTSLGGTNVVWGGNVVAGTNALWGSNAVWGVSSMRGFQVIWGTNTVWGTTTITGTNTVWGNFAPGSGERGY
ncbi:MAG: S8 family peptidase [Bryobacterales bacterium]|nr:S8 family peptidase [Bryobacterales bacterium]